MNDITNVQHQKHKNLTDYQYGKIAGAYELGNCTLTHIAKSMDLPISTVAKCIERIKTTNTAIPKKKPGRSKKLSDTAVRSLLRNVKKAPFEPIRSHNEILRLAGIDISIPTLTKYLEDNGYGSYVPAKKPRLTDEHKRKRLAWAKARLDWSFDKWSSVMWSDESRFTVTGNDAGARVIRKQGERYKESNILQTDKFGKGSVMVWSCFWAGGLGPLVILEENVNQDVYVNLLSKNFIPYFKKLEEDQNRKFIFQEDNAPCHTGSYSTWYRARWEIYPFDFWPAQSPDLNPIENVWAKLGQLISKRKSSIKNKADLKVALVEEWEKIQVSYLTILVESMPSRLKAVIEAKGGNTKY